MLITDIIIKGKELGYVFRDEQYHEIDVDPDDDSIIGYLHPEEVHEVPNGPWRPIIKTDFKILSAKYIQNAIIEYLDDGTIKLLTPDGKREIIFQIEIPHIIDTKNELNELIQKITES